jgi:hypothetical protein
MASRASPPARAAGRIQKLTVEQLLQGAQIAYPRLLDVTFKKAPRARVKEAVPMELPLADADEPEPEEPFSGLEE